MSFRIGGVSAPHLVVTLDKSGVETGPPEVEAFLADFRGGIITDIVVLCHGWKKDLPRAATQYGEWITSLEAQTDLKRAIESATHRELRSFYLGIHWPSLLLGVEHLDEPVVREMSTLKASDALDDEAALSPAALIALYTERLGDSPAVVGALTAIVDYATTGEGDLERLRAGELPTELDDQYRRLFAALDVDTGDPREPAFGTAGAFDPSAMTRAGIEAMEADPGNRIAATGFWRAFFDGVMVIPRQLSFWTMKARAQRIGETTVHKLLHHLQQALATSPDVRIHLMGHSFGCLLATAALAGPSRCPDSRTDRCSLKPVSSALLIQGALSAWSYADSIPGLPSDIPGRYRQVLDAESGMISGPTIVTVSKYDYAIRRMYPIAARAAGVLGTLTPGRYDGLGAYGVHGRALEAESLTIEEAATHSFRKRAVYNVHAETVIDCIADRFTGAHNDINDPEIARLLWAGALGART